MTMIVRPLTPIMRPVANVSIPLLLRQHVMTMIVIQQMFTIPKPVSVNSIRFHQAHVMTEIATPKMLMIPRTVFVSIPLFPPYNVMTMIARTV